MAEETEQMIWYSDVWSRRFVVCIAGMNPAGAEPSEWAVVYKCDQELRAQLGTRLVDAGQQRRFARKVNLVKKAIELDDGETCLYRSAPGVTSDVVNPSDETEQKTWYSDWLNRRFVFWTAGMNPAGAEPRDRTVVSICDQEPRAQLDASEETEQMIWYSDVWSRRFVALTAGMNPSPNAARNLELNLVQGSLIYNEVGLQDLSALLKKACDLDDGETCLHHCDPGVTSDVVNPSDETDQLIWRSYVWSLRFVVWIAGMIPTGVEPSERAVVSKRDQEPRARIGARFSLVPVYKRHEQQHGCDVNVSSFLERMVSMIRSNICQNNVLTRIVIFSCSSQSGPSILHTSLLIRRRQSEQQSHENFVDIANNTEMSDDVLEKNNSTIYVKTINKKTISICYYESMKAALMLEEVERRTAIPRDMTRVTHKGKAINGKKSMKDNNIDANETIEMLLRLLGGMDVNEQWTHTKQRKTEKRKGSLTKEKRGKRQNQVMT